MACLPGSHEPFTKCEHCHRATCPAIQETIPEMLERVKKVAGWENRTDEFVLSLLIKYYLEGEERERQNAIDRQGDVCLDWTGGRTD